MNKKELIEKIEKMIDKERQKGITEERFYESKRTGRLNSTGRIVQTRNTYAYWGMNEVLKLVKEFDE